MGWEERLQNVGHNGLGASGRAQKQAKVTPEKQGKGIPSNWHFKGSFIVVQTASFSLLWIAGTINVDPRTWDRLPA
jgi:hypothetical protein